MPSEHPFSSPERFVAIPRVEALALSPAGDRLVATVSHLDADGAALVPSLWEVDPGGETPARRLTRSAKGESAAAFASDGSLLFVSSRPRPSAGGNGAAEEERPALWSLPAGSGDPWVVAAPPGGVTGVATAKAAPAFVVLARSAPGAPDAESDRQWWSTRRKRKVSAVLLDSLPVRHWDHYLGPDEAHLYAGELGRGGAPGEAALRDLTPDAGQALHEAAPVLTPDGSAVVTEWLVTGQRGRFRVDLVAIDTSTGQRRVLASAEDGAYHYHAPQVSPDGRAVVCLRTSRATLTEPFVTDLWVVDLASGAGRPVSVGDGPTVDSARFDHDGSALLVVADWRGRRPLLRVDLDSGEVTHLTDDGSWSSPLVAPGGGAVFALRSAVDCPPRPVRLSLAGGGAGETALDAPGAVDSVPGRVEEVTARAADGTDLRAWLVLPAGDGPAPMALWVHGGPVSSWNDWHWRWNPWVLAAQGWAVLLPDPALSTGYGVEMLRRGWGQWGGAPYEDVMALTDAAASRPDVDAARLAMMGGSYGGYMANWIAGHTDRFAAIVSHASLWSLEQFQATTDWPEDWADEWGYPSTNPEHYEKWSPDRYADAITTPMLVTHGERDYRCPVGESLRLWTDLTRRGVPCRFLWFGEENHWVLKPADAVIWYETVLAFLGQHVLGHGWSRPAML